MADNQKIDFHNTMSSRMGKFGMSDDHSMHWVFDGADIVGVFKSEEALRVRPDNSATLSFPNASHSSWTSFVDRFASRFGVSAVRIKKTMSEGKYLEVETHKEGTFKVFDRKLEGDYVAPVNNRDWRGSWKPQAPTAVGPKTIDRKRIAARVAEIRKLWGVHCVTAKLHGANRQLHVWNTFVGDDWATDEVLRLQRLEFRDFAYFVARGNYYNRGSTEGWKKNLELALNRNKADLCARENLYL